VYDSYALVDVYLNIENGTFSSARPFSKIVPLDTKPVDINGDGKMEIIILNKLYKYEWFNILWIYCEIQ
jgi:hypothetical protein